MDFGDDKATIVRNHNPGLFTSTTNRKIFRTYEKPVENFDRVHTRCDNGCQNNQSSKDDIETDIVVQVKTKVNLNKSTTSDTADVPVVLGTQSSSDEDSISNYNLMNEQSIKEVKLSNPVYTTFTTKRPYIVTEQDRIGSNGFYPVIQRKQSQPDLILYNADNQYGINNRGDTPYYPTNDIIRNLLNEMNYKFNMYNPTTYNKFNTPFREQFIGHNYNHVNLGNFLGGKHRHNTWDDNSNYNHNHRNTDTCTCKNKDDNLNIGEFISIKDPGSHIDDKLAPLN